MKVSRNSCNAPQELLHGRQLFTQLSNGLPTFGRPSTQWLGRQPGRSTGQSYRRLVAAAAPRPPQGPQGGRRRIAATPVPLQQFDYLGCAPQEPQKDPEGRPCPPPTSCQRQSFCGGQHARLIPMICQQSNEVTERMLKLCVITVTNFC